LSPEATEVLMHLKELSFVSPAVQGGEVLRSSHPTKAIDRAIALSQAQECRTRSLPAHLVVCLVIAMMVKDLMRDVLKNWLMV